MASLALLPSEILFTVVSYLEAAWSCSNLNVDNLVYWSAKATEMEKCLSAYNVDLLSLLCTCRRFHALISPLAYKRISFNERPVKLSRYRKQVSKNSTFYSSATVEDVTGLPSEEIACAIDLMSLPNLKTITIPEYPLSSLTSHMLLRSPPALSTSNITNLRTGCHATSLHYFLTLPRALESLTYEWTSGGRGYDAREISTQMHFLSCGLAIHTASLCRLTLTRFQPDQLRGSTFFYPWTVVSRIDLSAFTALRELRIVRAFLLGTDEDAYLVRTNDDDGAARRVGVHETLPRSLRKLTVFYDDTRFYDKPFLEELEGREGGDGGGCWLGGLARRKGEFLPELRTVAVLSREWRDSWSKSARRMERLVGPLRDAFGALGVEFRVNLDVSWGEECWDL